MLSERVRSARPAKQEPPGHAARAYRDGPRRGASARRAADRVTHPGGSRPLDVAVRRAAADDRCVEHAERTAADARRASASRLLVAPHRSPAWRCSPPASARARPATCWDRLYDVVLYNAAYLPAAATSAWLAARRVRAERAGLARARASRCCSARSATSLRTLVAPGSAATGRIPLGRRRALRWPPTCRSTWRWSALIRARVPRFHPSMWLDGIIGALGRRRRRRRLPARARTSTPTDGGAGRRRRPAWPARSTDVAAARPARRRRRDPRACASTAPCSLLAAALSLHPRRRRRPVRPARSQGTLRRRRPARPHLAGRHRAWPRWPRTGAAAARRRSTATAGSRIGWRLLALPLACNVASLVVLGARLGRRAARPPPPGWPSAACWPRCARTARHLPRGPRPSTRSSEQARTDELTGLPNRRALLEQAAARRSPTATARRPAALLLLDLDGFKEVNDSLGPPRRRPPAAPGRPAAAAARCAPATSSPGSAATSSPSCCPTPGSTRRRRSPSGCAS